MWLYLMVIPVYYQVKDFHKNKKIKKKKNQSVRVLPWQLLVT